jgi:glycosyltransferase involved in cell wall biosynthesis
MMRSPDVAFVPPVTSPLPVSVCLISGAEEARIGRALASVSGWVAEIVVVLNEEVTDGTEAICRRHGARVIRHRWLGFREQKNLVQGHASQPWILQLDADEEVSEPLRAEIIAFFGGDHERHAGASFPRKVWFLGRWITHGDWYPDRVLRLYRGDAGRWGGSPEHCAVELTGPVTALHSDLWHFSNPTIASYVAKMPYFADLYLERQIASGARWQTLPVVIRCGWRFVRSYVFKRGFLDGYPGFFIAAATAFGALVRHSRLYEHQQPKLPPCPPARSR